MTTNFSSRLNFLAALIDERTEPLGVGLKNQCWAGVAHSIAQSEGARVTDYFGISTREMKDAIKMNNNCAPESRNATMRQVTLEIAATR
jgi:hypothetical protein